jgi:hypothetical protein
LPIGTDAVAAGTIRITFIAVAFRGITIVGTNKVVIIIIIIGFNEKDYANIIIIASDIDVVVVE